jgi:hypothetical protein
MARFLRQPELDLLNPLLAKERIQLLPDLSLQEPQFLKPDGIGHADPQATIADPGRTCRLRNDGPYGIAPHIPDLAILSTEGQMSLRKKS